MGSPAGLLKWCCPKRISHSLRSPFFEYSSVGRYGVTMELFGVLIFALFFFFKESHSIRSIGKRPSWDAWKTEPFRTH